MAERGWWGGLLDETAKLPEGIRQLVVDAVTRQPRTDPTQPVVTPGPGGLLDLTPVPGFTEAYKASDDVSKGGYEGGKAVGTYLGGLLGIIPAVGAVRKAGPIRAYHGSPHSFDKFELRPGTGEGGAAYGHGLYLAENEGVARSYRDSLSNSAIDVGGKKIRGIPGSPEDIALAWLENSKSAQSSDLYGWARENLKKTMDNPATNAITRERMNRALDVLDKWQVAGGKPTSAGHMYEVGIHADPAKMLDWDRRLSEQPEVQKLIRDLGLEREYQISASSSGGGPFMVRNAKTGGTINVASTREEAEQLARAWADPQGANVYQSSKLVPGDYSDPAAASAKLKEAGIPGIKYLDQGSRGSAGGELIGINKTDEGFKARIRVADRTGTGFQTPTTMFTTSMPFKTEEEAARWAADKIKGGTSNYVVFDPKIIEIMRKYGIPIGAGGAAAATVPGLLNEGQTY